MTGSHEVRGSIPLGSTNILITYGVYDPCFWLFVGLLVVDIRTPTIQLLDMRSRFQTIFLLPIFLPPAKDS
jgi:hypothetical protein